MRSEADVIEISIKLIYGLIRKGKQNYEVKNGETL